MKRNGLLLAILSVFALTSCDMLLPQAPSAKKRSSREEESEVVEDSYYNRSSSQKSSSVHKHSYGAWTRLVEPTCTEAGVEKRYCECGEYQTRTVAPLGHSFDIFVSSNATCTSDGYATYRCSRCSATTMVFEQACHEWGAYVTYSTYVEGYVGYNVYECIKCNWYQKIEIKALDGTLASGSSIKSGTPEGFMKLAGNNQSISWRFSLDIPRANGASYRGMLYQRASMDSFSSNESKLYGIYSASSSQTRPEGSFDVTVNGELVDKSAYMNMTFGELTQDGEINPVLESITTSPGPYSPLALCPIGEIILNHGDNEIVYTRTGSFNMVMSDLVMIVEPYSGSNEHVHVTSTDWSNDETQHWHGCVYSNCPDPDYKVDVSSHIWGEKYDEVAATCETDGSYKRQCSVCGYVRTYTTSKLGHSWYVDENYEIVQPTKTSAGSATLRCSNCNSVKIEDIIYGQTKETALTTDEALVIGEPLEHKAQTETSYYIKGRISEIVRLSESTSQATFWLASSNADRGFECYNINAGSLEILNSLQVGSEVLVFGAIHRYSTTIETATGARICSVRNETVAQPTGTFFTDIVLTDEGKAALNTSKSAIPFLLLLGDDNAVTVYADGKDAGAYIKSFDGSNGTLIIGTTLFGDLSMVYDSQLSMMMSLTIVNDLNYFAYNGITSLKGNEKIKYWNCDGTDEQLQEQFVRRYSNPWVVDTNNADRLTSNSEHYITGNGMRLRPWADGRIALALKDFDVAFNTNHLSFWVYNSGESNVALQAFAYKDKSFQNYFQLFSGSSAKAGEWTYFSVGFSSSDIYSFQIVISGGTAAPLIFDDIVLS